MNTTTTLNAREIAAFIKTGFQLEHGTSVKRVTVSANPTSRGYGQGEHTVHEVEAEVVHEGGEGGETIVLPVIHMGGTGAKMLFDGYREAMDKIQDADDAIRAIEFNQRDYYMQDAGAWERAREEMVARRRALERIKSEFLAICKHIQDQPGVNL